MPTAIEWAMESWNPVTGCTKVSIGCQNCYAERWAKRHQAMGTPGYENGFKVTLHPDKLDKPLHWRKPRRIFVCSMGDLFHREVPFGFIAEIFRVMAECSQHSFQVLTKRPERIAEFLQWDHKNPYEFSPRIAQMLSRKSIPNVWLGVTVENQELEWERVPILLDSWEGIKFVSHEPLLSNIYEIHDGIDMRIVGGETGPKARYSSDSQGRLIVTVEDCNRCDGGKVCMGMWLSWARDIRDQCERAKVPFFFKKPPGGGKAQADGFTANTPEDLKIRQYPREVPE